MIGYSNGQRVPPIGFSGGGSGYAVLDGCNALAAMSVMPTDYQTQAKLFTCYGAIVALGQAMGENGHYCPPENVTNGELTQVAVTYLVEHPAHLDKPYGELIFKALRRHWPCNGISKPY